MYRQFNEIKISFHDLAKCEPIPFLKHEPTDC